jgi:hypothetical protein
MAATKEAIVSRKRDYLFQRSGSQNWHVRLQYPGGQHKPVERSLRTSDRRQAEILAMPLIQEHKTRLLAARPALQTTWQPQYEPGREHVGPEGQRIIAMDRELLYLDAEGRTAK